MRNGSSTKHQKRENTGSIFLIIETNIIIKVLTANAHSILWAVSLNLPFSIIDNTHSLITKNILSMTLFSCGVCAVVY